MVLVLVLCILKKIVTVNVWRCSQRSGDDFKDMKDISSSLQSQIKFLESVSTSKDSHEIYSDIKDLHNEVHTNTKLLKDSILKDYVYQWYIIYWA